MMDSKVSAEAKEKISERLSCLENLYFPRSLQSTASNASERKAIFLDLLSRDTALFLERYGSKLTDSELSEFDALKGDYEINWHLKHLRSLMNPSEEELRLRSMTVKNRRRAYLDRLMYGGQYFSEDAMREREPYLHHEYVGKFQDPTGRGMARPGERWSETLMRRSEEAILVAKIRGEQQRLGVDQRDWVGNDRTQELEEEEEEEEEEEDDDPLDDDQEDKDKENRHSKEMCMGVPHPSNGTPSSLEGEGDAATISGEELQDRMDQFTYVMQQKFLMGEDHEHVDYPKIDNDETLDDHWQREANVDAEEKYFADD